MDSKAKNDNATTGVTGIITNVQRFSVHDGGGIRTVGFLKGCPFTCPWCCNPENLSFAPELSYKERLCIRCSMEPGAKGPDGCPRSAEECPTGAKEIAGRERTVADLVDELERDLPFFEESNGGVTLSGGECLAGRNQRYSMAVLEDARARGLNTAIETTLAVPLTDPDRLAAAVDTFLVDFKIADPKESREVLNLDVDLRDANLRQILAAGAHVVARMPIIPGYTDSRACVEANLARICELGIVRADVLPFHQLGESKYDSVGRDYSLGGVEQLHDEDVAWIVEAAEAMRLTVVVHGE